MTHPQDEAWAGQGEPIAWRPTPEYLERSRLRRFMQRHQIAKYPDLLARATADPAWFWAAVSDDLDLRWHQPFTRVLDTSAGWEWTRWFIDGQFNYVSNALDKHIGLMGEGSVPARPDHVAVIWEGEEGTVRTLTYAELARLTNQAAHALAALGVGKGDRVGIFMPMIPEVVAATLACGKLGAIFIPIFSGYGPEAVASRLRDAEATVLVTADGFFRRGKLVEMLETAREAVALALTIKTTLVVARAGRDLSLVAPQEQWWHDAVTDRTGEFTTVVTGAEDPYMLIYTSGTTGRPKGAVHTHCGFPDQGARRIWRTVSTCSPTTRCSG